MIDYKDFLSDILEDVNGDNADEVRDQDQKKKLLSSLFLIYVKIGNLRFSS